VGTGQAQRESPLRQPGRSWRILPPGKRLPSGVGSWPLRPAGPVGHLPAPRGPREALVVPLRGRQPLLRGDRCRRDEDAPIRRRPCRSACAPARAALQPPDRRPHRTRTITARGLVQGFGYGGIRPRIAATQFLRKPPSEGLLRDRLARAGVDDEQDDHILLKPLCSAVLHDPTLAGRRDERRTPALGLALRPLIGPWDVWPAICGATNDHALSLPRPGRAMKPSVGLSRRLRATPSGGAQAVRDRFSPSNRREAGPDLGTWGERRADSSWGEPADRSPGGQGAGSGRVYPNDAMPERRPNRSREDSRYRVWPTRTLRRRPSELARDRPA
jgi:hypothetical protein